MTNTIRTSLALALLLVACDEKSEASSNATCAEWAATQLQDIGAQRVDEGLYGALLAACYHEVEQGRAPCVTASGTGNCRRSVGVQHVIEIKGTPNVQAQIAEVEVP